MQPEVIAGLLITAILCGAEKDADIIEAFIQLQHAQEMLWMQFTDEHYDFPPM